jgi:hypothetical protein
MSSFVLEINYFYNKISILPFMKLSNRSGLKSNKKVDSQTYKDCKKD